MMKTKARSIALLSMLIFSGTWLFGSCKDEKAAYEGDSPKQLMSGDQAEVEESLSSPDPGFPELDRPTRVNAHQCFQLLLAEEDTDGDKKITVDDRGKGQGGAGDARLVIESVSGERYLVSGTYPLSNLLQELALAQDRGENVATVDPSRVYENPALRVSRLIRELYWDNLTRRVDEDTLSMMVQDPKMATADGLNYLYVSHQDLSALEYFQAAAAANPEWNLKVIRLPARVSPSYVLAMEDRHGILPLALEKQDGKTRGVPFVVPGGRFNEMYGWDSYFETLGLIVDKRVELAEAMVVNFIYEINNYGKILNANRSYYLTRSQPPFLTSMALAVYREQENAPGAKERLKEALSAAIQEYHLVWMSAPRVSSNGLSRYYGEGIGPCPEVEPGHYDHILKPRADSLGISPKAYLDGYKSGLYQDPSLDEFFVHDRAVRESGHDTTYRFDNRTAHFLSVDLNSLLYKYEIDLASAIDEIFAGRLELPDGRVESAEPWRKRASVRKAKMNELMWDEERGMFFDYDLKNQRRSGYVSATTFYPMWAGLATPEQAKALVQNALPLLEQAGGISASTLESRGPITRARPQRQWDYPYGWPPHQMLIWDGLVRYGFEEDARRLAYRWLYMIAKNAADYNGTVPEKYDVVDRTHLVFAEYGNVGTKFSYITREGFGWMNASFQAGIQVIGPKLLDRLKNLDPPETVFNRKDATREE